MISASLDALLRQRSSVEVMDYLRQLISPQIAIEKTPEISYSGQALARCIFRLSEFAVSASDAAFRLPGSGPWMKRQNSGFEMRRPNSPSVQRAEVQA
jgi:hypothetical protein